MTETALSTPDFLDYTGTIIGVVSAYFRGWLDTLVQRLMDSFQAFPALLLLILVISAFNPDLTVMALALGFVGVTSVQRIVRGWCSPPGSSLTWRRPASGSECYNWTNWRTLVPGTPWTRTQSSLRCSPGATPLCGEETHERSHV